MLTSDEQGQLTAVTETNSTAATETWNAPTVTTALGRGHRISGSAGKAVQGMTTIIFTDQTRARGRGRPRYD